jgi:uncharacterized protein
MPKSSPKSNSVRNTLSKVSSRVLRLNVGFLLKEGVGYSRDFRFDEPVVQVADDLTVHDLSGTVTLTRTPQGLYAQGRLTGTVDHECARCLEGYDQTVSARLAELYHYPPESAPPDSLTISDDVHLDLTPVVREDLLLSIPMHALCRPDCKGLCPQCGANWNEGPCDCRDETIDPRLAPLARLLKPDEDDDQEVPDN